jgi:U3 small nucleolar RNA-associated protein 14
MAPRCQLVEPIESESQNQNDSDADSDVSAIFTDNGSENESSSESELESEDSDNESDTGDESDKDEGQLPPEHYLAEAEGLDVSRLRQKRYSDSTQEKLDQTAAY